MSDYDPKKLVAACYWADDLLRRLSEWDVLNLKPLGGGDDGPYWQSEIAAVRKLLAADALLMASTTEIAELQAQLAQEAEWHHRAEQGWADENARANEAEARLATMESCNCWPDPISSRACPKCGRRGVAFDHWRDRHHQFEQALRDAIEHIEAGWALRKSILLLLSDENGKTAEAD